MNRKKQTNSNLISKNRYFYMVNNLWILIKTLEKEIFKKLSY
jgi:hypothetical protein